MFQNLLLSKTEIQTRQQRTAKLHKKEDPGHLKNDLWEIGC